MKRLTATAALVQTDGTHALYEIRVGEATLSKAGVWILNEPKRAPGTPQLVVEGGAATKYTDPRVAAFERSWAEALGAATPATLP